MQRAWPLSLSLLVLVLATVAAFSRHADFSAAGTLIVTAIAAFLSLIGIWRLTA
ncbi:MAG TPA: hypothetical protein VHK90_16490 [Thermoanaerobaculia bacterium]|nr:hypothetical protein [Thermoanaerobaculia bacterium]